MESKYKKAIALSLILVVCIIFAVLWFTVLRNDIIGVISSVCAIVPIGGLMYLFKDDSVAYGKKAFHRLRAKSKFNMSDLIKKYKSEKSGGHNDEEVFVDDESYHTKNKVTDFEIDKIICEREINRLSKESKAGERLQSFVDTLQRIDGDYNLNDSEKLLLKEVALIDKFPYKDALVSNNIKLMKKDRYETRPFPEVIQTHVQAHFEHHINKKFGKRPMQTNPDRPGQIIAPDVYKVPDEHVLTLLLSGIGTNKMTKADIAFVCHHYFKEYYKLDNLDKEYNFLGKGYDIYKCNRNIISMIINDLKNEDLLPLFTKHKDLLCIKKAYQLIDFLQNYNPIAKDTQLTLNDRDKELIQELKDEIFKRPPTHDLDYRDPMSGLSNLTKIKLFEAHDELAYLCHTGNVLYLNLARVGQAYGTLFHRIHKATNIYRYNPKHSTGATKYFTSPREIYIDGADEANKLLSTDPDIAHATPPIVESASESLRCPSSKINMNDIEKDKTKYCEHAEYKKLALKLHPDKNSDCVASSNSKMQELNGLCKSSNHNTQSSLSKVPKDNTIYKLAQYDNNAQISKLNDVVYFNKEVDIDQDFINFLSGIKLIGKAIHDFDNIKTLSGLKFEIDLYSNEYIGEPMKAILKHMNKIESPAV